MEEWNLNQSFRVLADVDGSNKRLAVDVVPGKDRYQAGLNGKVLTTIMFDTGAKRWIQVSGDLKDEVVQEIGQGIVEHHEF